MTTDYFVDPAAAGANNGTSWTDAWTTLDSAFSTAAAGDTVYCRGTQAIGVGQAQVLDASGSIASGYIKFIGCNASGNVDGTRYVLNVNASQAQCIYANAARDYLWFENIEISGGQNAFQVTTTCDNWVLNNCYIHGQSASAMDNGQNYLYAQFIRCIFADCAYGFEGGSTITLTGCKFDTCTYGIYNAAGVRVSDCLFIDCSNTGLHHNTGTVVKNCVFHGDGVGCNLTGGVSPVLFESCRFTGNTTGLTNSGAAILLNCYFDNTTDISNSGSLTYLSVDGSTAHVVTGGSDTDYGYVNSAGEDFNLASGATGRNVAIEID